MKILVVVHNTKYMTFYFYLSACIPRTTVFVYHLHHKNNNMQS